MRRYLGYILRKVVRCGDGLFWSVIESSTSGEQSNEKQHVVGLVFNVERRASPVGG